MDGLTLDMSYDTLARIYHATIQSVAYGTRHILDEMEKQGYAIAQINACGGGTKNALWIQEHADATQRPIHLPKEPEAVLLGAAILGAVAAGKFASIQEAMRAMCRAGEVVEPTERPQITMRGNANSSWRCTISNCRAAGVKIANLIARSFNGHSSRHCRFGAFAQHFIPLFKAHPGVDQVILCDLNAEKRRMSSEKHGIAQTSPSLDDLCGTDIDAIALFTQNWLHGPQATRALRANKHVYSAVPPGISLGELRAIAEAVCETGKIYMLGETSYYSPAVIYCRRRFRERAFGEVVYAEAEYYHDWDHGLYEVAKWRGGENWARNRWHAAHVLSHPFDQPDSLCHRRAHDPRLMLRRCRSPRGQNLRLKPVAQSLQQ